MTSQQDNLKRIWEACLNHDRKQQELLYKMIAPKMLRVARQYANNPDEAQDILQEGMIKVFNNLHNYRGEGSFEGWIRRIIVHTAISRYRKLKNMVLVEDFSETTVIHPAARNENNLELKEMMNLVNELPSPYRSVFNMYAIEGYSHQEISNSLGISELLSRTTLHRARGVLKERMNRLQQKEKCRMAV